MHLKIYPFILCNYLHLRSTNTNYACQPITLASHYLKSSYLPYDYRILEYLWKFNFLLHLRYKRCKVSG